MRKRIAFAIEWLTGARMRAKARNCGHACAQMRARAHTYEPNSVWRQTAYLKGVWALVPLLTDLQLVSVILLDPVCFPSILTRLRS